MPRPIDFSSMTLDELTPIVSMRPGKAYSREELRMARKAFMDALSITEEETSAPLETDELVSVPDETTLSKPLEKEMPVSVEAEAAATVEATASLENEAAFSALEAPTILPSEEISPANTQSFVLENESRLARFLYVLYAYILVPILAAEALVFLISTVLLAILVPDTPYLFVHILSAAFYTMFVSVAWHQFLHRTQLGLFLNRSLIGVCIFRGTAMLLAGTSALMGVIFLALSFLFLVFFVGYDATFIIPSQD